MWERVAVDEWWLREYGRSPGEVRELPAYLVERLPHIALLRQQEQEKRSKAPG